MRKIILLLLFISLAGIVSAQNYQLPNNDASCPANCRQIPWHTGSDIWNNVSLPANAGTLPNYTSVTCTGLAGNGTTNDGPAIQACINALSNNQCALVPAGTYLLNTNITIPTGAKKCLRGALPLGSPFLPAVDATKTTLVYGASGQITLGSGITHPTTATAKAITSGYTKGSTSIVMPSVSGLSVGMFITISEQPDPTGTNGLVLQPTGQDGLCSWCGWDDGVHILNQVVKITSIVGTTVSFDQPLYMTYSTALNPVVGIMGSTSTQSGIENIRLNGSPTDHNNPFITINGCFDGCWLKGVETYDAGTGAKNGHVFFEWSRGAEVRDSYFHFGREVGSDRDYGLHFFWVNSNHKIENNILREHRHSFAPEGGGTGIAFLYNYVDNNAEDDPTYLGAALGNHGAHPLFNLFEGNIISHQLSDNFFGSSSHEVLYRNSIWGDETPDASPNFNNRPSVGAWPLDFWKLQNFYSAVGNVLGITGKWVNPNYSTYTLRTTGTSGSDWIYEIGLYPFPPTSYDANPNANAIVHRNYDMKTHSVAFDVAGQPTTLDASLYYTAQPTAWWKVGSYTAPWPSIGPDIASGNLAGTDAHVNQNPAMACFLTGGSVCFSAAGSSTVATPTFSPSAGTYTSTQTVSLATITAGATICFTTNGTTPGTNGAGTCVGSTTYSTPITVSVTTTINAVGTISGSSDSSMASGVFTITPSAPVASLTPASHGFGNQQLSVASAAFAFTLQNTGNASMTISSVSTTGPFAQTNTCPVNLGVAASCTINVTFTPVATGAASGTVSVVDNAAGSPHSSSLTGTGVQGIASFSYTGSPSNLVFSSQTVGTTSASQSINVTNTGTSALGVTSITTSGDFAQTNNCPASVPISGSCTILVTFTPTLAGARTGNVTFTSNGAGSPQSVPLSGTGVAATACGMSVSAGGGITISSGGVAMSCP